MQIKKLNGLGEVIQNFRGSSTTSIDVIMSKFLLILSGEN